MQQVCLELCFVVQQVDAELCFGVRQVDVVVIQCCDDVLVDHHHLLQHHVQLRYHYLFGHAVQT